MQVPNIDAFIDVLISDGTVIYTPSSFEELNTVVAVPPSLPASNAIFTQGYLDKSTLEKFNEDISSKFNGLKFLFCMMSGLFVLLFCC